MSIKRETNKDLELAEGYVQQTGHHVFLTGKAGTGKTTFLKNLQHSCSKRLITTAPTGVAALNAGGVTLHSFFQLPFGPFVPGSEAFEKDQQRRFRISKQKKNIIQSLDLLVIDEISMVRADLLDAVDAALRHHRRSSQPFGGVQLLMIGDLHQLAPVAKPDEWNLLQEYYESVYFFSSHALTQTQFMTIELGRIYRQSDDTFIHILNQVRDNKLDPDALQKLNTRYYPDFVPDTEQGYITLTSHNKKAQKINQHRLKELPSQEYSFPARISGDFPEHIYPTSSTLLLKKEAQVMFVRNDPGSEKLYYNGKIGRITAISQEEIQVLCPGEQEPVAVEPLTWENIKYFINPENKNIQEEVIGSFTQYPLKPAWAITIHKSQGLTFERAIIDVHNAFTHGQVYVALSRCKSMQGLVLSSPLPPRGLDTNEAILSFDRQVKENPPSKEHLQQARVIFQQRLVLECFDMEPLQRRLKYVLRLFAKNSHLFQLTGVSDIKALEGQAGEIFEVSRSFLRELGSNFSPDRVPATDAYVLERSKKGYLWFQEKLDNRLVRPLAAIELATDNTELKKKISNALDILKKDVAVKLAGIKSCEQGFCPEAYLQAVARAEVDITFDKRKKKQSLDPAGSEISHQELLQTLQEWRTAKAKDFGLPAYQVLHQQVILQIALNLPQTQAELEQIKGVGAKTIAKYGQELIDMVSVYRLKYGIEQAFLPERVASAHKKQTRPMGQAGDTRRTTLELFKKGHSPEQIAADRGLARSTIESHLSFLVHQGELHLDELLPPETQEKINRAISLAEGKSLKAIKEILGHEISYGQIKIVLAHQGTFIR